MERQVRVALEWAEDYRQVLVAKVLSCVESAVLGSVIEN